ncbi:mediator complex, subunit Med18 [Lophiotrema nucula]|uniref:Mediator of RNA polymerase II transcription subunit 18 n=1 Tax=Lophiotrema nucula TaxID=690887 RepID=A0A6A5ZHF3_9PLEO|nr:mediator complex, subunit Med18 [Lophiotrema nucula]
MHELLLYGQVPESRHEQLLKILAGVAAMQPRHVVERHLVYKPQREPEEPGAHLRRGGTQNVGVKFKQVGQKDLYFTQLVQRLSVEDFNKSETNQPGLVIADGESAPESKWTFEFQDVPQPVNENHGVLDRMTHSTEVLSGNVHEYMAQIGNQFVSEYYQDGHLFVHDNIVLLLHRVLAEPAPATTQSTPKERLPSFDSLKPLDSQGTYVLEAKIRLHDRDRKGANEKDAKGTDVMSKGVEELRRFKNQMKGCVDLTTPDRLLLDTRVKYKPKTLAQPARPGQVVR